MQWVLHFGMSPADSRNASADFQALLMPQLDAAYRTAYRLSGNPLDAEDLVQEASLLAWRGFGSFEAGTNFRAWFFRILTNAFYSRYRKARREGQPVELEEVPELYLWRQSSAAGLNDVLQDPAAALLARLDAEEVNAAIAALPEEYRMVAALYFMDDLPYQEIADMLGVPIGTVRSRLHRARRLLQRALWETAVERGVVSTPTPGEGSDE
jgi:RNA polymerase sigma-70 factor (ECF subfamily)